MRELATVALSLALVLGAVIALGFFLGEVAEIVYLDSSPLQMFGWYVLAGVLAETHEWVVKRV